MIWLILTGLILTIIEIVVDIQLWKRKVNDKPYTTLGRFLIMAMIAGFIPGNLYLNFFVIFSTHFLLFDFSLNLSRWNKIPMPYSWKLEHMAKMNKNDYIKYGLECFITTLFWHGDELKGWNLTEWYDKFWQRIPPPMELLIKGTVFSIAIYYN